MSINRINKSSDLTSFSRLLFKQEEDQSSFTKEVSRNETEDFNRFYNQFSLIKIASFLAMTILLLLSVSVSAQNFKLAVLKYNGGGDWYANLTTSVPNLISFCNKELKSEIEQEQGVVEVGSKELFNYPFVHMTGHGNVIFSDTEVQNLRKYLLSGGFLHIDDNYGMDQFVRSEIKKLFPEYELLELPFSHPIYHQRFNFTNGLPKIHEHDNSRPEGLGIIHNGRLVLFYSYESDLGDGWESPEVHGDSEAARTKALQMGANLIQYVLMGNDPDSF